MYYLGAFYGTYLSAVYAELFPTRIARAVLDGPEAPNLTTKQLDLGQAQGFQTELTRFIADCVTHPECPLGTDATIAGHKLADFLTTTQVHPLPTGTSRTLDDWVMSRPSCRPTNTLPRSSVPPSRGLI